MIVTNLHKGLSVHPLPMKDIATVRFVRDEKGDERYLITKIEGKDSNFIMNDRGERFYPSFFNRLVNELNARSTTRSSKSKSTSATRPIWKSSTSFAAISTSRISSGWHRLLAGKPERPDELRNSFCRFHRSRLPPQVPCHRTDRRCGIRRRDGRRCAKSSTVREIESAALGKEA